MIGTCLGLGGIPAPLATPVLSSRFVPGRETVGDCRGFRAGQGMLTHRLAQLFLHLPGAFRVEF